MVAPGVGSMDQAEVMSFIKGSASGVLALVDGDRPYAVPLEHHFDGRTLSFITSGRRGRKRNCIENNANACYVIYESRRQNPEKATTCRSVVIEGRVTLHGTTLKMAIDRIGNWKCPPAMFATCDVA